MTDLISRQEAIDVLRIEEELLRRVLDDMDVVGQDREKYSWGLGLIESYISDIEELPSAELVRHGKWAPKYIKICGQDWASGMKCSECGEDALNAEDNEFLTNYCPNCGARMDQ